MPLQQLKNATFYIWHNNKGKYEKIPLFYLQVEQKLPGVIYEK